jgi:predicted nuclease of restriction endonuclease-like (RecB) superfamily
MKKEKNKSTTAPDYRDVLDNIISKVQKTRYSMQKKVNAETIVLYWQIGEIVHHKTEDGNWGSSVVEQLSKDLQNEFNGVRGFSSRNIWRMKAFYETYKSHEFLPPAVAEIGWVQNYIIIEKCKNEQERTFYLYQTKEKGWSKSDLLEKIQSHYYENKLLTQNNFETVVSDDLKARTAWEFIDDYSIEILNPDLPIAEKELENSIILNLEKFLNSMGGNFAFIGRQFRIEYREKEYFVDLLFFNLNLNCYVVFELKAREFSPKDIGQLQMYLMAVNEVVKKPSHNASIGILVCRDKDRLVVEYLLNAQNQPIGVSTYNKYNHLEEMPNEIAKHLPSEDEIFKRLSFLGKNDDIKKLSGK